MTKILWNRRGEKKIESGVDRGVLYLPDGRAVPWNGLTGVEEDTGSVTVEAFYYDGIKFNISRSPGDFSGSLKAFMYPEEFEPFDGFSEIKNGLLLSNQPVYERFGLSYCTGIGNDTQGMQHGYKIHLLYNLVASPDTKSASTITDQTNPQDFSWKIEGLPEPVVGHRPTAHVVIDTTKLNRFLVALLEDILYGKGVAVADDEILDGGELSSPTSGTPIDGGSPTASSSDIVDGNDFNTTEPRLPPLQELVDLVETWSPIFITANGDGSWTADGPDELFHFTDSTMVDITGAVVVPIDADTYTISSS